MGKIGGYLEFDAKDPASSVGHSVKESRLGDPRL